jgi:hypothetical protein
MQKSFYLLLVILCISCGQKNAIQNTADSTASTTPTTTTTESSSHDHNHPKISDMISNPATANEEKVDPKQAAVIEFEHKLYEFGKVKAGTFVTHDFHFKNTGKNPLIIKDAQASCGCTVADFPKEPIAPGGSGVIKAKFDTEGRNSMQAKYISVYANTIPSLTKLVMEGEVFEK